MPSLRKTVITARDAISTVPRDLVFIQYVFTDGEREVLVNVMEMQRRKDAVHIREQ